MQSDHPTYRTCGTQGCEYPARYCIDHAHAIGRQAERRIVEWLRDGAFYGDSDYRQDCTRRLADAIERGEHRA